MVPQEKSEKSWAHSDAKLLYSRSVLICHLKTLPEVRSEGLNREEEATLNMLDISMSVCKKKRKGKFPARMSSYRCYWKGNTAHQKFQEFQVLQGPVQCSLL